MMTLVTLPASQTQSALFIYPPTMFCSISDVQMFRRGKSFRKARFLVRLCRNGPLCIQNRKFDRVTLR